MNKRLSNPHNLDSYGQHYLTDPEIMAKLVAVANIDKSDIVIEVGAGDGRISKIIAEQARKVIAYEIDTRTKSEIEQLQRNFPNIEVRWMNFLKSEQDFSAGKLVASLPYQITEPFIEKISMWKLESATLLVGRTFADNICAEQPKTKLSLLTKCYFDPQLLFYVNRMAFFPPPRTESAVVKLHPRSYQDLMATPALYIMRELFEQRDKRILNALREGLIRFFQANGHVLTKRMSKEYVRTFLETTHLDLEKGLEQMTNKDILALYNALPFLLEISK